MIMGMAASESECFFVYSADPSLTYLLTADVSPAHPLLVGKVWKGAELQIKGPETVMPETVTAQDAIAPGSLPWVSPRLPRYLPVFLGIAKISATFCRPAHVDKVVLCPHTECPCLPLDLWN